MGNPSALVVLVSIMLIIASVIVAPGVASWFGL